MDMDTLQRTRSKRQRDKRQETRDKRKVRQGKQHNLCSQYHEVCWYEVRVQCCVFVLTATTFATMLHTYTNHKKKKLPIVPLGLTMVTSNVHGRLCTAASTHHYFFCKCSMSCLRHTKRCGWIMPQYFICLIAHRPWSTTHTEQTQTQTKAMTVPCVLTWTTISLLQMVCCSVYHQYL